MKKETLRNIKKELENNKPVDGIGFSTGTFIVYGENKTIHIVYMEKSGGFYKYEYNTLNNNEFEHIQNMPKFILDQLKEAIKNIKIKQENKIAA